MNGFVAILANQPDGSVSEAEINAFAHTYVALRGGVSEFAQAGDHVRTVTFANREDAGPAIHRRGRSWAVSAGTPHHRGSLLDTDLDDIEGQFALLRYDADTNTSTLASDPFGMFGVFISRRDGLTYVSTSALALARHLGAAPSRLGLHTFLLAGYQCGTRTNWDSIERVGAGSRIDFGPDGWRQATYWRPLVDHAVQRLGISASVDRCLESAVEAVRMVGAGREVVWCDLTGGYDTRMLALLARTAGVSFITTTNGERDEEDVRLARRVSETAGWEWSLVSLPERWEQILPKRIPEAIGWGDGALDAVQLAAVLWGHEFKSKRARRVFGGGGGEFYWSYAWQQEYGQSMRTGPTSLERWVRIRMLRGVRTRVFTRDPMPEVVADLRTRMEPVIEPYVDEPRAVQADVLHMHKSTGHFGAYTSAATAHVDGLLPFYTRARFTTVFSTNPRHRFGHRFYRRLIYRLDPKIAAIPTTWGSPAQPLRVTNLAAFAPYYARLGERGLNKAGQRFLGRSVRRPVWVGDDRAARIRAAAVACVGSDIDTWHSQALYDREELREMLAAVGRADFRESVLLNRILTAELGLRAAGVPVE
jgi:hypothetical protein